MCFAAQYFFWMGILNTFMSALRFFRWWHISLFSHLSMFIYYHIYIYLILKGYLFPKIFFLSSFTPLNVIPKLTSFFSVECKRRYFIVWSKKHFTEESKSKSSGATWGWVHDDMIFILIVNHPKLEKCTQCGWIITCYHLQNFSAVITVLNIAIQKKHWAA